MISSPDDPTRRDVADAAALRIVYYGPGRGGKTANLIALARLLPDGEARLRRLDADRGDALEFLACDASELGLDDDRRLHLYAAPGRYVRGRARRTLLNDVDGVIFVADSRRSRLDADVLLLDELGANLAAAGRVPPAVGLVLQYNHADALDAVAPERLDRELNRHDGPRVVSVACDGIGVLDVLRLLLEHLPQPGPRDSHSA